MTGRNGKRLFQIDNGMRHYNAFSTDIQWVFRCSPQKRIKSDKNFLLQSGFDDFCPMSRYIVTIKVRVYDVTIFLGIGPFAQERILNVGALGDQDIFSDPGTFFDDGESIHRSSPGDGYRQFQVNLIKNTFKISFSLLNKIYDDAAGRALAGNEINITIQDGAGIPI